MLRWTDTTIAWTIERFRAVEPEREQVIAALAAGGPTRVAAFDGPLRRGFDIIGRYRSAERMLTRRLQPLIGKPGQSNSPVGRMLNLHANACLAHVLGHGAVAEARHAVAIDARAVVEAFPSTFLGLMIAGPAGLAARRADRSDTFFRHLASSGGLVALLQHCLPGRSLAQDVDDIVNHDDRAAFVCALTALCVTVDDFTAVGDAIDGWIILPPRAFIQPAQWSLLSQTASSETTGTLHASRQS